ncbi:hypothetical protein DCM91_06425 [Chitinophaga costaii]|nr:hypothetical protein [Chitinophaga costaii]PUZ27837.1 hypothetical protein DCM91_06425 [Chitinophaga costaii]
MAAFLGLSLQVSAQQFSVHATADTNHIRLGEPVKLQVEVKIPASLKGQYQLSMAVLPDSFEHFEVVERAKLDTLAPTADFSGIFRQTTTLTSFDSGQWNIPPIKYELIKPDQTVDSAFTEPLVIDVNTVAVDTSKAFKPIKSIRGVAWNFMDYIWYFVMGGVAVLLIGFVIWWFFLRKKKAPVVVAPPAPKETPYQVAMRELHTLETDQPWHQDVKAYYTTLTDVLRNYFEQQFKIAALEQTSAELLQNIKPVTILNQQRDKLQAILTVADLAKFAKLQPSPEDHAECLQKAIAIVEWTKPKPVAETAGEKAAPTKSAL